MAGETIKTLREVRRNYILKVLDEAAGDYGKASKVLNVSEEYLRREVKRFAPDAPGQGKEPVPPGSE